MVSRMRSFIALLLLSLALFFTPGITAQLGGDSPTVPVGQLLESAVKQSRLGAPGMVPFHLKASSAPANSYNAPIHAEIEEYWVSPNKWRRTIRSKDFEQTVIVNGDSRFEQNSSNYLPKWLNDIVTAIFDVAPKQTIEEVSKLEDQILRPDGERGACGVSYPQSSTYGTATVNWGGGLAFDRRAGLLSSIITMRFSAVFKEYQPFHGQIVARLIETFPIDPHGDLNTQVTELDDLKDPDESMFAISQPTPPEQQLRLVRVPEVEYRKLAIDPPVMKWPSLKVRPTSGSLATYIVTDRTGKVREARFIVSNNMSLRDGAVELVRQWRFKPLLIDGVPVEVETTMTFSYDTDIVGDQAKFQAASYYFQRGRDLTFPRTDGSPAFHLKGTFEGAGIFAGFQGAYEETWIAPNRWRREITILEATIVESRIDEDYYMQPVASGIYKIVDRVFSLFGGEFPGYAYASPDTDWNMADVEFENTPAIRVGMGRMGDDGQMQYPFAYYFDQDGKLLARTSNPETIIYSEFAEFAGKQIPHRIDSKFDGVHALSARIVLIEPAKPQPDEFFELRGVEPTDWIRPRPW